MATNQKPGSVIFAKDPAKLAKFYRELLSLSETHSEKGLVVLESDIQQIVFHGLPKRIAEPINITEPPKPRQDTAIKLVFPVISIAETRAKAPGLGGYVMDKTHEFIARRFRACDGVDPEGNVIQFREAAD